MGPTVLLADDHVMLRQALRAQLEQEGFNVVGEASDGVEAVRLAQSLHPNVAVLDVSMPLLNGVDAACEIIKNSPQTQVLLVTVHDNREIVLRAVRAGVKGYVLKTRTVYDLVAAVREVANGNMYLSPEVSGSVVSAFIQGVEAADDPLSIREREILQLVAEGKSTKDIATVLNISVNTVEKHRGNIMEKLKVHDIAGLVKYAMRIGLVQ